MALSVFGLKGCMEKDEQKPQEAVENGWQQFALTLVVLMVIALCNFVFSPRDVIQALLDRRGRKRKWESEIPDNDAGVEVEELEVPAGEQASASTGPIPPTTSPPRGPPPRAPKLSPIPVGPPPRWDPWSPEWFLYFMLGRVNRRMQCRGQQMDHNALRRYNHRRDILEMRLGILEQSHSEGVRRRAHMMCRGMTDLLPDSGSAAGPEIEEEEEPENESIATHYYVGEAAASSGLTGATADSQFREELDEADGYFDEAMFQGEIFLCLQQSKAKMMKQQMKLKMKKLKRLVIRNIDKSYVILAAKMKQAVRTVETTTIDL